MFAITETLIDNFTSYLSGQNRSISTIKKYTHDIQKFSDYLYSTNKNLNQDSVNEYVKFIKCSGYSTRSINSVIASINSFCRFIGHPEISCKSLKITKRNNRDAQMRLTTEEYFALIRTAMINGDFRMAQIIQVLGCTELRMNELQYLTVDAVEMGVVMVRRAGEEYAVFLSEQLADALKKYIIHYDIEDGMVFGTSEGNAMDRSYIWRQLKLLAAKAGVDPDKVYPQNLKRQLVKDYLDITY